MKIIFHRLDLGQRLRETHESSNKVGAFRSAVRLFAGSCRLRKYMKSFAVAAVAPQNDPSLLLSLGRASKRFLLQLQTGHSRLSEQK